MIKCEKCGKELPDNTKFCPECGTQIQQVPAAKVSPFGVIGFVLSLVLAVICPSGVIPSYGMMFLIAIPSVVLCIIGVFDTKNTKRGLAIAGLIITTVAILFGGIFRMR